MAAFRFGSIVFPLTIKIKNDGTKGGRCQLSGIIGDLYEGIKKFIINGQK